MERKRKEAEEEKRREETEYRRERCNSMRDLIFRFSFDNER